MNKLINGIDIKECLIQQCQLIDKTQIQFLKQKLDQKYYSNFNFYFAKPINEILANLSCSQVIQYKDLLYDDEENDYLKRYYDKSESQTRLNILSNFYKNNYKDTRPNLCLVQSNKIIQKRNLKYAKIFFMNHQQEESNLQIPREEEQNNMERILPSLLHESAQNSMFNYNNGLHDNEFMKEEQYEGSFVGELNRHEKIVSYETSMHDIYGSQNSDDSKYNKNVKLIKQEDEISQIRLRSSQKSKSQSPQYTQQRFFSQEKNDFKNNIDPNDHLYSYIYDDIEKSSFMMEQSSDILQLNQMIESKQNLDQKKQKKVFNIDLNKLNIKPYDDKADDNQRVFRNEFCSVTDRMKKTSIKDFLQEAKNKYRSDMKTQESSRNIIQKQEAMIVGAISDRYYEIVDKNDNKLSQQLFKLGKPSISNIKSIKNINSINLKNIQLFQKKNEDPPLLSGRTASKDNKKQNLNQIKKQSIIEIHKIMKNSVKQHLLKNFKLDQPIKKHQVTNSNDSIQGFVTTRSTKTDEDKIPLKKLQNQNQEKFNKIQHSNNTKQIFNLFKKKSNTQDFQNSEEFKKLSISSKYQDQQQLKKI